MRQYVATIFGSARQQIGRNYESMELTRLSPSFWIR